MAGHTRSARAHERPAEVERALRILESRGPRVRHIQELNDGRMALASAAASSASRRPAVHWRDPPLATDPVALAQRSAGATGELQRPSPAAPPTLHLTTLLQGPSSPTRDWIRLAGLPTRQLRRNSPARSATAWNVGPLQPADGTAMPGNLTPKDWDLGVML
ncbi:MAG: hypothetical protein ACRDNS_07645 [Trebonia sp.]